MINRIFIFLLSLFLQNIQNTSILWMYSVCSFRYMLAISFCDFFKFQGIDIGWIGWVLPIAFGSSFHVCTLSLTANVSHGTIGLALCLVGMHSAAASKWALTKFSYSLFGVCASIFCASNLFLSANAYLSLICLLLSRGQSSCTVVVFWAVFLHRLSRIFVMTIQLSEDTPSKEEFASQFNVLLFHFLFIKM